MAHGSQELVRFKPRAADRHRMPRPMRSTRRSKPAPAILPPVLGLTEAEPLAALLLSRRGAPLVLDGSAVERLGAQCLQVLLAARHTWEADGQPFRIETPSQAFTEAAHIFGASSFAHSVREASA